MWRWILAAVAACVAGHASAADFKTLRSLESPPPVTVPKLEAGTKANPVRLSKVVLQPREGEGWAAVYTTLIFYNEDNPPPPDHVVPWEGGRIEADLPALARIFDEELEAAGFKTKMQSLFEESSATDLQVGVLIDDLKGRFCVDCPNIFQRDKVAAVVTMSAHWEVYSTLRSAVVARVTTNTGATLRRKAPLSITGIVYDAFRENVRALLAADDFRQAVTGSPSAGAGAPSSEPINFLAPTNAKRNIASSADAVAAIFAGDAFGSGFLISSDGYLLTNRHVVGDAKYVKVRWADKEETVGEVIRADRRRDVAVVKVNSGTRRALALSHAEPSLGANVFVIGTPLDAKLQGTVTKGVVSGKRELNGLSYIQSDAVTNHGNSGGPLLNEDGAVIGIAVQIYEIGGAPVGVSLFIPMDDALKVLGLKPTG